MKLLRNLTPLLLVCFLLLGYGYTESAWTEPGTGSIAATNTDAPLTVGNAAQVKSGSLGVDALAVFGDALVDGSSPTIKFSDIENKDFWLHADNDNFYLLGDRNDDGSWSGESPWPFMVHLGATSTDDYVTFSNEVRADKFCDAAGGNCFSPGPTGTSSERVLQVASLSRGPYITDANARAGWNQMVNDMVTYAGFSPSGSWVQQCTWENSESRPTSNNSSADNSANDVLNSCGFEMCRSHPDLNLGIANVIMSDTRHCGLGGGTCLKGAFTINCIY